MLDKAISFIARLRPPHPLDNGDKEIHEKAQLYEVHVRAWRWKVFYGLVVLTVFSVFVYCAMFFSVPGFGKLAWANDVDTKIEAALKPVQDKVDKIERQTSAIKAKQATKDIEDLRQKIFETRIAQCKARAANSENPYSKRLQELQDQFYDLNKAYYQLPDCEDL